LIAVATPYCARVLLQVVQAQDKYIVSVVIAIVTAPLQLFTNVIAVQIGKDTELFAGIV